MAATTYPDYLGASGTDTIDRAFQRIALSIVSARSQFLFGAGMSADSRVPLGTEFSIKLLELFFPTTARTPPTREQLLTLAQDYPLECIAGAVERTQGKRRTDLTEFLRSIFLEPEYQLSAAHEMLTTILFWGESPILETVLTTNFDTLIEEVAPSRMVSIHEANAADIQPARNAGKIPVLHLHGILSGDDTYQITEADVYSGTYRVLTGAFRSALTTADAFVFVGYSVKDPDFRRVYMQYREEIELRGATDKQTYVVSPAASNLAYRLGSEVWHDRGATWLPFSAADFFSHLRRVLESDSEGRLREQAKHALGVENQATLEDNLNSVSKLLRISRADALRFLAEFYRHRGGAR